MIRALGECIAVVVCTLGVLYFLLDSLWNWGT